MSTSVSRLLGGADATVVELLAVLFDALFGCAHRNRAFPRTPVDRKTGRRGQSYEVCLECGKEIPWRWKSEDAPVPVAGEPRSEVV